MRTISGRIAGFIVWVAGWIVHGKIACSLDAGEMDR